MKTTPLHPVAAVVFAAVLCLRMSFADAADVARQSNSRPAQSSDRVALTGHVLPALAQATPDLAKAGINRGDEPLTLTVVLN